MHVFTNCRIFDGENEDLKTGLNVFIDGDKVKEVSDRVPTAVDGNVIDSGGRVLMPGLIDAHIHAYANDINTTVISSTPPTLYSHHAAYMLGRMLDRGFTSVRDTGGADYGLHLAIERGYFPSPRLYYCGKAISMTGGHGDFRHPHHHQPMEDCVSCGCSSVSHLCIVVDGTTAVLHAVRENLRRGASFIKFMGSGGVSSIGDSITGIQFSDEEVLAIVQEVERHELYCTAHIHPDRALKRAIKLGVHCIEHGTLVEADTARMAADAGTYVVPTMATIASLADRGEQLDFPRESLKKLALVKNEAIERLAHYRDAGVKVGFGTDLLGKLEEDQCTEFTLRANIYSNYEILRQATSINGEILGEKGRLGVIKAGAYADILLVDGNPLEDLNVVSSNGANFAMIMKGGAVYRDWLSRSQGRLE